MWHATLLRSPFTTTLLVALLLLLDSASAVRSLRSGKPAAGVVLPGIEPVVGHSAAVHNSHEHEHEQHDAVPVVSQKDTEQALSHPFSPNYYQRHYELVPIGAAVVLYGVTCCVVLVASALMVCCMYDAAAHWFHRSYFLSCQNKVQRVHEVFIKKRGEATMCPYCVEFISPSSRMSQPVVFLCGHRFHMECANKWFREHPEKSGRCPLCEAGCGTPLNIESPSCKCCPPPPTALALATNSKQRLLEAPGSQPEDTSSNDEALSFILGSLHREFPEIITKDCVKRWSHCHTEIWLSELRCPKYNSLLQKQLK